MVSFMTTPIKVREKSGRRRITAWSLVAIFLSVTGESQVKSPAWPQWGGPNHDFKIEAGNLASSWSEKGPPRLWSRELGEGYSGIAASENQLFTMYREGDSEVVIAMDAGTGKTVWEYRYEARFTGFNKDGGPGPHAMPLLVGERIFAVGATGKFHCLDRQTGKVLWSHDLYGEFGGTVLKFGYSCNPVAYKGLVILLVGGQRHAIMAFNQKDGSVAWGKQDFTNAYSTPLLINVGGQDQLVAFMATEIAGIDPQNGELLWSHPHTTLNGLAVSRPVWGADNLLFFSSAYNGGSRCLRLSRIRGKTVVRELWDNNKVYVHFGNIIRVGDYIYCSSGQFGPAFFTAIEAKTGKIAWQEKMPKASFLYVNGKFIIVDEDGHLMLATASPAGLKVHAKVELLNHNAWTVPTLVGTRLYVRDRKTIVALELG
jgi:outer membrane protein assembly factor BamB